MRIFQHRGFSLVMVLIIAAVFGGLTVVLSQTLITGAKTQGHLQQLQASGLLHLSLLDLLQDRATCNANFGATSGPRQVTVPIPDGDPSDDNFLPEPTSFVNAGGTPVAAVNDYYEGQTLQLQSIRVVDFRPRTLTFPDTHRGALAVLVVLKKSGSYFGSDEIHKVIELSVVLRGFITGNQGDRQIETCAAVGNGVNEDWAMSGTGDVFFGVNQPALNVGIGPLVTSPVHKFQVQNGNMLARDYLYISDERIKENIKPSPGLELVERLRGVHYRDKDSGQLKYGVIAQEVEEVMPEAVFTDPNSGMKSVDYNQIIGPLLEAIKDLDQANSEIEEQILLDQQDLDQLLHNI